MAVKLIGTDTPGDANGQSGYVAVCQFICAVSGILDAIKLYCLVNSNVRVALYTDTGSDTCGDLVAESASTPITSGDWRSVAVAGGAITSGTKYWLAFQSETNLAGGTYRLTTHKRGYIAQPYGAFPADGTGFTYDTILELALQGWGIVPAGRSFGFIIG